MKRSCVSDGDNAFRWRCIEKKVERQLIAFIAIYEAPTHLRVSRVDDVRTRLSGLLTLAMNLLHPPYSTLARNFYVQRACYFLPPRARAHTHTRARTTLRPVILYIEIVELASEPSRSRQRPIRKPYRFVRIIFFFQRFPPNSCQIFNARAPNPMKSFHFVR